MKKMEHSLTGMTKEQTDQMIKWSKQMNTREELGNHIYLSGYDMFKMIRFLESILDLIGLTEPFKPYQE